MDDFKGVMDNSLRMASDLGQSSAELAVNDVPDHWKRIELTAQSLANVLRIKDPKGARKCTFHTHITSRGYWGIQAIKTTTQTTNTPPWVEPPFRRPSTLC